MSLVCVVSCISFVSTAIELPWVPYGTSAREAGGVPLFTPGGTLSNTLGGTLSLPPYATSDAL